MLFTDHLGHTFSLPQPPHRIVSLVPSQTELLANLGLDDEVVGITKFCVHPDRWFRTKTRVGGTKQLNPDRIRDLNPDLILANREENTRAEVEALAASFPVWTSDIKNLEDALDMIQSVGTLTGKEKEALLILEQIRKGFNGLATTAPAAPIPAAYLIWRKPWMTVGGDTFIHDMLQRAGFENIYGAASRYPEISLEELSEKDCRLLLLSSEPYPFGDKHIAELQQKLPGTQILLCDGEYFSWYGSRLIYAPACFQQLRNRALSLF